MVFFETPWDISMSALGIFSCRDVDECAIGTSQVKIFYLNIAWAVFWLSEFSDYFNWSLGLEVFTDEALKQIKMFGINDKQTRISRETFINYFGAHRAESWLFGTYYCRNNSWF